ncbi:MAG: hypothetical protein ACI399_00200 [Candidatus Cryptobacteroides sp.]
MMKRTIAAIVAILGLTFIASAQPKALGVRIGNGIDLSYEHNLVGVNFLEFEAGLDGYNGNDLHLDGVYNFMIATPDWTSAGSWGFYGGPGVGLALVNVPDSDGASVFAGIVGNLGLEYTFNIPLQISLDIRPRLMFGNNNVWTDGIFSFGLGLRYAF